MNNDFDGDYKTLLDKSGKCTMEVKYHRTLGFVVFKTLNLNPAFMEEIFHKTKWLTPRPNNIQVNVSKTAQYGEKGLKILGPHMWSSLTEYAKAEIDFIKFREYIN